MDAANLITLWSSPDNSRLTAKQQSFRLPIHVAAKIAALAELYPQKSKTQIVGDLLASALALVEKELPTHPGRRFTEDEVEGELFVAVGPGQRFRELANKHYQAYEKEAGNDAAPPLYDRVLLVSRDGK